MEYSPAEIRPHLEWRHGHGQPPENQHHGQPSLTGKNPDLPSSLFPSSPDDFEQANPMSLKRKMTRRPDSEGRKEALVPKKVLRKGESSNLVGMEIDPKPPATDKEVLAATQDVESPPTELATLPKNPLFDELGVEQRSVKGNLVLPNQWRIIKGVRSPRVIVGMKINTPAAGNVPSPSCQVEMIVSAGSPVAVKGAKLQPSTTSDQVVERNGTRTGVNLNKHSVLNDVSDNVPSSSRQVEVNLSASSPVAVKGIFDASSNVPSSPRQVEVTLSASLPVAVEGIKPQQPTTTSDRVVASGNFPSPCRQVEAMMSANSPVVVRDVSDSAAMNNQEIGLPTTHDVAPRNRTASEGEDRAPPPPANVDPTPIVSLPKRIPFRKTSVLWEKVESLEVFRAIPQDPHFCLVEKQSGRDLCEGIAIGLMVTFDNLVKDIRKLDVTDSNQAFVERLGSLKMLEENGFYVESLRTRIAELLQEKLKLSEINNKMTTLKEKVYGVSSEKDRIGVTSFVVDKTIDEVEMHLARLNDKKQDLATQEILKEAELTELKKQVGASVKAYHSGVQRFRRIAAAPW